MAQLKDLIVNGPSRFIGDVYATTFTGNLSGNADSATKAVQDGDGNVIKNTYIKVVSLGSGTNNGTLKLIVNDIITDNISVTGLGSAAYTDSSAYATAGHTHEFASLTSKPETLAGYGIKDGVTSEALLAHTSNEELHIQIGERDTWNSKYSKPDTGIPKEDLTEGLQSDINKINTALTDAKDAKQAITVHASDGAAHITAADRTSWKNESAQINSNFEKINTELERLKNITTRDKGYYQTVEALVSAYPTAPSGSRAFVGYAAPYAVYIWDDTTSAWVDTGQTITDPTIDLGDYYTKDDVDDLIFTINMALGTKFGALYVDAATGIMSVFASESDKQEWFDTGDSNLILTQVNVGVGGGGGGGGGSTSYQLSLKSDGDVIKTFSTTDTNAYINFYFVAKQKTPDSSIWEEMPGESVSYTIEVSTGGSAFTQVTQGYLLAGAKEKFDVRKFLVAGSSTLIRIKAVGDFTGLTAALTYNYSLTSMAIAPANFTWYTPFIQNTPYSLGGLTITGNLEKTLYVKVSSSALSYTKVYTKALGTQTWVATPFSYTEMEFPATGTGVYKVEIWLESSGLESKHLIYNIICVSSEDQYTARLVTMSDVASQVINYTDNKLFSYAIYNKGGAVGDPTIILTKTEGGSTSTFYSDTLSGVTTAAPHDFTTSVEIASSNSDISVEARLTFGNEQTATFTLDNSASFPATNGAVFYMNPASRSNSQTNYLNIVNEVSNEGIEAEWTNMAWADGTDGWTIDGAGRKCLCLPATTKCVVSGITPMSTFGTSKTLEFTFKAENAADYSEPIITICDNPLSEKFRGIKILPDKIIVHSRDKQNDLVQSYPFQDEKTIHLVVTIQKNYKVTYGNLCKIYANGVGVCSFAFTNTDSWINEGYLQMGSDTADLFVYNIRQYESGFGPADAFRNFLASLPDLTTKRAENTDYYKVLNDGEQVDYDVLKNTENTMVIEMLNGAELPQYGFGKKYDAQCNLWLKIFDEVEGIDPVGRKLTGAYLNQTISGQGTTSMNYFRWNLRWKMDDDYGIRITAKKNYASSMQSHKMGATALYNDVYKKLGLSNGSTGRVAVYQYPVYGFLKKLKEGTTQYYYEFIGLFTVGPDKGDKKTFGFKDSGLKDTVINLEGTDHTPAGVGFDYPWSQLKYIKSNEAFGAPLSNGTYEKAYEVGNCGTAKTEEAIQAYLDQEFAPAYNVVFENSTMIIGTSTPLSTINADVTSWGRNKDPEGHLYNRYMVWIDGDYTLYYLNRATNQYTSTGINLQTQNGTPSGNTIEEKNEWFKNKRRARFKENMENYWDLEDLLFHDVFLLIIAASDNLKKNFYPQKFAKLADGGRWGFRQDDLDSILRTDNQAHQTKEYSVEQFDWTDENKTAYVFKGEDSALHHLLYECYPDEVRQMGYRILDAMASLSDTGTNAIDKLMGCFEKYFFGKAQDYFTKSAYNSDAEYSYEEAWPLYKNTYFVDTHPLEQSLGGNEESERGWLWLRMIYCMSMFRYGTFATYTDTSLGRITYRPQYAQSFTLTPSIDLYPTILPGQGTGVCSTERIKAGKSVTLPAVGGGNTNIYIPASDYIRDIGDLRTLAVDSAAGSMSVAGKRLQRLKLGDPDASTVTSTLTGLTIGACPSLTEIDARNVTGLTETIDLTNCPRIKSAYFGGTDVKSVIVPSGAKIANLQLSDATTTISLVDLPKLSSEGLTYGELSNVEYLRIEDCPNLDAFGMLKELYYNRHLSVVELLSENITTSPCTLGSDGKWYLGSYNECHICIPLKAGEEITIEVLEAGTIPSYAFLASYKPPYSTGTSIPFASGETGRHIIQGTSVTVTAPTGTNYIAFTIIDGAGVLYKYKITTRQYNQFVSSLKNIRVTDFVYDGNAIDVDMVMNLAKDIAADGSTVDYTGIDSEGAPQQTLAPIIEGTLNVAGSVYEDSASFVREQYPNLELNVAGGFYVRFADKAVEDICVTNWGDGIGITEAQAAAVTSVGTKFRGNTTITTFDEFSKFTNITEFPENGYGDMNAFSKCTALRTITLPPSFTKIGGGNAGYGSGYCAFNGCTSLENINVPATLYYIGSHAFIGCKSLSRIDLSNITYIGYGSFAGCSKLNDLVDTSKVETLGSNAFRECKSLQRISLPSLTSDLGTDTFTWCASLERIDSLGTTPKTIAGGQAGGYNNYGFAYECTSLTYVDLSCITSIGAYAFSKCTSLTDINLSPTLTAIGSHAFYNCTLLSGITLPPSLTTIGDSAFDGCSSLEIEDLALPNLTSLGQNAFYGVSIRKITNLGKITSLPNSSSNNQNFGKKDILEEIVLPETITYIPWNSFQGYSNLKKINTENIEIVGGYVFVNTLDGVELRMPKLSTIEGNQLFYNSGVTILDFRGSTFTDTKDSFAQGATNLHTVYLPDTLTRIGHSAFSNCASLVNVTLPTSLTTIDTKAFNGCASLEIKDLSLPNLEVLGTNAFNTVKISKVSNLGKITTINPNIGDKSVLREITLPNTIKTIGDQTFRNCSALETITIESGASGISVGNLAFYDLPSSVNFNFDLGAFVSLGKAAFGGISTWRDVTFANLTTIGARAFMGSSITAITLPSVKTMAATSDYEGIFSSCQNLTLVDIGENCTSIGDCSFGRFVGARGNNITVIVRATTPPSLEGPLINTSWVYATVGRLYVPDASVNAYKAATNWSQYADIIYPLSEYE